MATFIRIGGQDVPYELGLCNKCKLPVPLGDDSAVLNFILDRRPAALFNHRHLLRSEMCEGSPSRAQYIEGQPRDSRGYPYIQEKFEARTREAYALMQTLEIIEK